MPINTNKQKTYNKYTNDQNDAQNTNIDNNRSDIDSIFDILTETTVFGLIEPYTNGLIIGSIIETPETNPSTFSNFTAKVDLTTVIFSNVLKDHSMRFNNGIVINNVLLEGVGGNGTIDIDDVIYSINWFDNTTLNITWRNLNGSTFIQDVYIDLIIEKGGGGATDPRTITLEQQAQKLNTDGNFDTTLVSQPKIINSNPTSTDDLTTKSYQDAITNNLDSRTTTNTNDIILITSDVTDLDNVTDAQGTLIAGNTSNISVNTSKIVNLDINGRVINSPTNVKDIVPLETLTLETTTNISGDITTDVKNMELVEVQGAQLIKEYAITSLTGQDIDLSDFIKPNGETNNLIFSIIDATGIDNISVDGTQDGGLILKNFFNAQDSSNSVRNILNSTENITSGVITSFGKLFIIIQKDEVSTSSSAVASEKYVWNDVNSNPFRVKSSSGNSIMIIKEV